MFKAIKKFFKDLFAANAKDGSGDYRYEVKYEHDLPKETTTLVDAYVSMTLPVVEKSEVKVYRNGKLIPTPDGILSQPVLMGGAGGESQTFNFSNDADLPLLKAKKKKKKSKKKDKKKNKKKKK